MRHDHACPKCGGTSLLRIGQVPDTGEYASEIRALHIATVVTGKAWLTGGDVLGVAGQLTAWVCRQCGYTELYTLGADQIPIDGKFVSLVER